MGKGAAKYGFKSGVLPTTRSILKSPTTKQTDIINKVKSPKPKGVLGIGYAKGVKHPKGSHRLSPKVNFIDVDNLIAKTVAEPQSIKSSNGSAQKVRLQKAELRRKFLIEAFRKEEARLLHKHEYLQKRTKELEKAKELELEKLNKEKSSDLTIMTLDKMMSQPLLRNRSPEESELLKLKRNYNRSLLNFQAHKKKLNELLNLYHVANEFIVTESQLLKKIDKVFNDETEEFTDAYDVTSNFTQFGNRKLLLSGNTTLQTQINNAIMGSLSNEKFFDISLVDSYLNKDLKNISNKIDSKLNPTSNGAGNNGNNNNTTNL
ncbi:ANL_collapsed_G0051210.mRNA.1.CDS.1 [Saccharomyces cerevisiae]|nr:AVN_HP_G0146050.mRNA.1.CDS.1 [Saccharomyces cerevisiae]CAI5003604.1 AVN_HP_G0046270.mRNA.1.CDS.1 [Saccharomyces cerevisiae]CAI5201272.1 ANL_HP_G0141060.mRNA.1.CDS.1 [Saccharomyces cerevisiae]CAI6515050.1 AVN_HP_G0146050.mRNA.1.CDS.1 [Saccharomyces cerevisiae]CAI6889107.1 ANL_collapsed_G0051210.mRNA.1.CDS.1 [Saccharomyces cerevisiae]